jgi:mono/diheme cytochrome c family protein
MGNVLDQLQASRPTSARHQLLVHVVTIVVIAVLVLAACKAQPERNSGGGAAAPAVQTGGAATYSQSCARCHGANQEGVGTGPALTAVRIASIGDQPLRLVLAYGKGEMPGFGGLSEAQVTELIAFLRGL